MRKIILAFLTALISLNAFSNTQLPDIIIYNGAKYSLDTYHLEDFFKKNPAMRPFSGMTSTNLWRGYVATFEVIDNQLFLKDIEIKVWDSLNKVKHDAFYDSIAKIPGIKMTTQYQTKWKSVYNLIFPKQPKLKIDWFIGLLVMPYGKKINTNSDSTSNYKKYFLLEIYNGDLTNEKNLEYDQFEKFKDLQFEAFKKTDDYEKVKKELIHEYKELIDPNTETDHILDQYIRKSITYYTTKFLTS